MALDPKSISRTGKSLRVTFEILFILFVIVTSPLAWFMTPPDDRAHVLPQFAFLMLGVVVWTAVDLYRVVAARRRELAEELGTDFGPRRDAIWDYAEKTDGILEYTASPLMLPFSGAVSGTDLLTGVVQRTRAAPMGGERPDVSSALELAMAATGLAKPPELYWAPGAGANAVVAGTPDAYLVVLGESLVATFKPEALLGVFANLLVRVEHGAVRSISGWDPPGLLNNNERLRPLMAVALYEAADAQAVLALRDTETLFAALMATVMSDPFLPGLTPDQANLMWTWPSSFAPIGSDSDDDLAAVALAFGLGGADRTRLELTRIDKIARALKMSRPPSDPEDHGPGGASALR